MMQQIWPLQSWLALQAIVAAALLQPEAKLAQVP
jgi:hypothetical protein